METQLYIPQAPPAPPQAPPPIPAPPPRIATSPGDAVFLDEGGILVSKTRFMVHSQTFALANITSVKVGKIPPSVGQFVMGLLIGLALALFGVAICAGGERDSLVLGVALAVGGLLLAGFALFMMMKAKPSYAVVLSTAGGELKTCISKNPDFILRVVGALNEAIVARG
jgi:hypothetical protein